MSGLSVAIFALDDEQRTVLQMQVDSTTIARTVHGFNTYPISSSDAVMRRLHELNPDVILLDIPSINSAAALRAVELLHEEMSRAPIFAVGDLAQPQTIVNAMRNGAREFLERPVTTNALLEAFVRLAAAQRKAKINEDRGKIIAVVNAKGGNGATTVAVNTSLALQASHSNVALVDMAPLGHVALHLNLKPAFTVQDALKNLHRLDASLLESFMTQHSGLHVLAGAMTPFADSTGGEFARLFDVLVEHYRYVVVDLSTRLDGSAHVIMDIADTILLVAQADVASLWSASRVLKFVGESGHSERVRLVLNRFRKIPGFSEADAEAATGAKLFCKLPNHFPAVASSIDRGTPVFQQNHSEIARSFAGLAAALTAAEDGKPKTWSLFKTAI